MTVLNVRLELKKNIKTVNFAVFFIMLLPCLFVSHLILTFFFVLFSMMFSRFTPMFPAKLLLYLIPHFSRVLCLHRVWTHISELHTPISKKLLE